ncbi:MAG TPA: glycosyltransferase family 4 protein, partial [bacterium]
VQFDGVKNGRELSTLIQNSRFVIVPSEWYDNSPLVIYESFAYGKPVIGARLGGIPELIDHHKTGMLFDAGNDKQLSDSMNHLLERPQLVSEFGRQARIKAEREFEPEHHYDKIYAWYQEMLSN